MQINIVTGTETAYGETNITAEPRVQASRILGTLHSFSVHVFKPIHVSTLDCSSSTLVQFGNGYIFGPVMLHACHTGLLQWLVTAKKW